MTFQQSAACWQRPALGISHSIDLVRVSARRAHRVAETELPVGRKLYWRSPDTLLVPIDADNVIGTKICMETSKTLRNREQRVYREYRSQRLVPEAWDRLLADAAEIGRPS